MTTRGAKRVAAGLALFIGALVRPSAACDMDSPHAFDGPLFDASPGGVALVPQNLAFLVRIDRLGAGETVRVGELLSGEPIVGRPIPGVVASPRQLIVRADPLLPANTQIIPLRFDVPGDPLHTGDFVDEAPPAQPELLSGDIEFHEGSSGCSYDSCGDYTDMELVVGVATDDRTPSPNLVYAVYLGESAASALSATMPIVLVYRREQSVWAFVDNKWADVDAYAAISVYDMAGNESPRSQPVRVNAESSSCGLARGSRGRGFSISIVAAAAFAACMRRLGKRFRQSS